MLVIYWSITLCDVTLDKRTAVFRFYLRIPDWNKGCRDHMVVGFTTTYAISAYHEYSCEVYSIQYYVIKFVSDLKHVSGFLWVLQFPTPIKLTVTI